MDFSIGTIAFWLIGFGLMFGVTNGIFGTTLFAPSTADIDGADWNWTFFDFPDCICRNSSNYRFRCNG